MRMNAGLIRAVAVILALSASSARAQSAGWARVTHLPVSSEIEVQRREGPPLRSLFVGADPTSLIVVNVSNVVVPEDLRRKVGAMLRHHPEAFAKQRPTPVAEGKLRLGADGLFAGRRKIAERDDLIEAIDRASVLKIVATEPPSSWINGNRGALIGLGIGAALGWAALGARCRGECGYEGIMATIFSGAAGAGVGALIGSDFRPIPERTLVYSAP
jgi:hypothetical protein